MTQQQGKVEAEDSHSIGGHVHRIGYHFRTNIVERAAASIGLSPHVDEEGNVVYASPDIIPARQEDINKQADAALRDLYPRIPNTDRELIIRHAFLKGHTYGGKPVVGMQKELSLSRRVQLAVLAHIRHNHTRYDQLLRETTWENARRAVEAPCLDIIIKWRGDEETGRDQLDEILREVVVISDSEEGDSDDEDEGDDEDSSDDDSDESTPEKDETTLSSQPSLPKPTLPAAPRRRHLAGVNMNTTESEREAPIASRLRGKKKLPRAKGRDRRYRKGLKRYGDRVETAWKEAINRRHGRQHRDLDAPAAADTSSMRNQPGDARGASVPGPSGYHRALRVYEDPVANRAPTHVDLLTNNAGVQQHIGPSTAHRSTNSPRDYASPSGRHNDHAPRERLADRGSPFLPLRVDDDRPYAEHRYHPASNLRPHTRPASRNDSQQIVNVNKDMPIPSIESSQAPANGFAPLRLPYVGASDDEYEPQVSLQYQDAAQRLREPPYPSGVISPRHVEHPSKRRRVLDEGPPPVVAPDRYQPLEMPIQAPRREQERPFQIPADVDRPGHYVDRPAQRIVRVVRGVPQHDIPPLGTLSLHDRQHISQPGSERPRSQHQQDWPRTTLGSHFTGTEVDNAPLQLDMYHPKAPLPRSHPGAMSVQQPWLPSSTEYRERPAPDRFSSLSASAASHLHYASGTGGPSAVLHTYSRPIMHDSHSQDMHPTGHRLDEHVRGGYSGVRSNHIPFDEQSRSM